MSLSLTARLLAQSGSGQDLAGQSGEEGCRRQEARRSAACPARSRVLPSNVPLCRRHRTRPPFGLYELHHQSATVSAVRNRVAGQKEKPTQRLRGCSECPSAAGTATGLMGGSSWPRLPTRLVSRTTSAVSRSLVTNRREWSADQAKSAMWPEGKCVSCLGGPPAIGCSHTLLIWFSTRRYWTALPSKAQ